MMREDQVRKFRDHPYTVTARYQDAKLEELDPSDDNPAALGDFLRSLGIDEEALWVVAIQRALRCYAITTGQGHILEEMMRNPHQQAHVEIPLEMLAISNPQTLLAAMSSAEMDGFMIGYTVGKAEAEKKQ